MKESGQGSPKTPLPRHQSCNRNCENIRSLKSRRCYCP